MKNLTIAFLAAISLMSFSACKKKGGSGDMLAKLEDYKNQMCKCTDKACADKVMEDMTKWGTESAKTMDKDAKPSEDEMKKSQAISEELSKCMMKVSMPATPPPAAPPAGETPPAAPAEGSAAAPAAAPAGEGSAAAPAPGSGSN